MNTIQIRNDNYKTIHPCIINQHKSSNSKSSKSPSSIQSNPQEKPQAHIPFIPINPIQPHQNRIGPYIIGKTLGVGSTCKVRLGTHYKTNQTVAIKIIQKDKLIGIKQDNKDSYKLKLEREITIMKLIRHDHVLYLYDVYESPTELLLILEHIEGGELFDYIVKKGKLHENESLAFFQHIISGVGHFHKFHVCHRDLKPGMDIFYEFQSRRPGKMLETSCGSPHYASPEIVRGIKYNGSTSDIWSCGIILYALLTGNLPFDDENMRKLLTKVKLGFFTIPSFVNPIAQDLIRKMLRVDPLERASMKSIKEHPWFNSHLPKSGLKTLALKKNQCESIKELLININDPIHEPEMDILESIVLLGWSDVEQVKSILKTSGHHLSKVLYILLVNRKRDMNESYRMTGEHHYIEGSPRRRMDHIYPMLKVDSSAGDIDISVHNQLITKHMLGPRKNEKQRRIVSEMTFSQRNPNEMNQVNIANKRVDQNNLGTKGIEPSGVINLKEGGVNRIDVGTKEVINLKENGLINSEQNGIVNNELKPHPNILTFNDSNITLFGDEGIKQKGDSKKSWFSHLFQSSKEHLIKPKNDMVRIPCKDIKEIQDILKKYSIQFVESVIGNERGVGFKCKWLDPISKKSVKFKIDFENGEAWFFHQGPFSVISDLLELFIDDKIQEEEEESRMNYHELN